MKSSASHRSQARNPPTANSIAAIVSALSKTPNHLSVIFDVGVSTDDMNLEKIIQQAAELAACLRCKSLVPEQPHRIAVYLNGRRLLEDDDTNPDGEQPGHSLYLISENDGQRALRSITEALTERVKHGDLTIDDISVDLVAEQLHLLVMPAPDLIVVFGSELNLSGYPLWHLQQAELETLYNEDEFGFLAFAHALQSYAGAEMRYAAGPHEVPAEPRVRDREWPISDAIYVEQGNSAHHSAANETPDDSPAGQDPDKDDDDDNKDDDDEDLIPGDLLEGDSDSGGESDIGNDAVSVANGLLGSGGAGSAALNNQTSGSTAVFCSLFACASAAQSDGKVSTSASSSGPSTIARASGPLVSVKGPLVVINVSRTSSVGKNF
ncbi:hypothetical protein MY4038_000954 [Beauveria bassiana]